MLDPSPCLFLSLSSVCFLWILCPPSLLTCLLLSIAMDFDFVVSMAWACVPMMHSSTIVVPVWEAEQVAGSSDPSKDSNAESTWCTTLSPLQSFFCMERISMVLDPCLRFDWLESFLSPSQEKDCPWSDAIEDVPESWPVSASEYAVFPFDSARVVSALLSGACVLASSSQRIECCPQK